MSRNEAESRGSHGESAYEALRALVLDGSLGPGTSVREEAVAARLGVSRTPVRDAFQRLVTDGLLVRTGARGLVVAELDQQQIIELHAMREVLEALAARLAARHASGPEVVALRELVGRQRECVLDSVLSTRLNNQFHNAVAQIARNRYLGAELKTLVELGSLMRGVAEVPAWRREASVDEHERLVNAIERRDGEAAAAVAAAHVRATCEVRMVLLFGGEYRSSSRLAGATA